MHANETRVSGFIYPVFKVIVGSVQGRYFRVNGRLGRLGGVLVVNGGVGGKHGVLVTYLCITFNLFLLNSYGSSCICSGRAPS